MGSLTGDFTNRIHTLEKLFDAQPIAVSQSAQSKEIYLSQYELTGSFAIYVVVSGDGSAAFRILQSSDADQEGNGVFIKDETVSDVLTAITKTSGPNGDGKIRKSFDLGPSKAMKLEVEELGTDSIEVTAYLDMV